MNDTAAERDFKRLIARVEKAKGIRKTKAGLTYSPGNRLHLPDFQRIAIEHSLRQASDFGAEELLAAKSKDVPFRITSASSDDNKIIREVATAYQLAADKITALQIVMSETTTTYHWWGVELDLTVRALDAMETLLDPGMAVVLAAMFASRTAGVLLLVIKGLGKGIKTQLKKVRSRTGVSIVLYLYAYPVPKKRLPAA